MPFICGVSVQRSTQSKEQQSAYEAAWKLKANHGTDPLLRYVIGRWLRASIKSR